jgi:creatinine amidohydrolase
MRIAGMNWMQVEARVAEDDRCVLPLGSVEQHAYLSLATDAILAGKVAEEAAAPLGVPVFPALPYGMVSTFLAYPGTVSLKLSTYLAVVGDLLDSLHRSGFRRIVLVNGHGGNTPVAPLIGEWLAEHPDAEVKLHDWWRAPKTWAKVMEIDRAASHASWMENFPWTRLDGVAMPDGAKPEIDRARVVRSNPAEKRRLIGDGNFLGLYQRPDADMAAIWSVAVDETRTEIAEGWNRCAP